MTWKSFCTCKISLVSNGTQNHLEYLARERQGVVDVWFIMVLKAVRHSVGGEGSTIEDVVRVGDSKDENRRTSI